MMDDEEFHVTFTIQWEYVLTNEGVHVISTSQSESSKGNM